MKKVYFGLSVCVCVCVMFSRVEEIDTHKSVYLNYAPKSYLAMQLKKLES